MRKKLLLSAMVIAGLCSCINNDYDLSDIDTTSRISVNNLTVPVNIDEITLDNILDLDDGSRIQKQANGEYAIVEEGTFNSGAISISPINISKPQIQTIKNQLTANLSGLDRIPEVYNDKTFGEVKPYLQTLGIDDNTTLMHFEMQKNTANINFSSANVDSHITSIKRVGTQGATLQISLKFSGISSIVSKYHINNLKIQLPMGLELSENNYNPETGVLQYDEMTPDENGVLSFSLTLNAINAEEAGATLENRYFHFAQEVSAEGEINLYAGDINENAKVKALKSAGSESNPINYECNVGFANDIKITTFSGGVMYEIDKPNIAPVNLSNLPSILMQSGTKIEMSNPQIYLSVDNPIDAKFNIHPQARLQLTPNYANQYGPFVQNITLDKPKSIFCMAPNPNNVSYVGYEGATPLQFSNLGQILACTDDGNDKVPSSIIIDVYPKVEQEVVDFELKDYGNVTGKYAFYAPLSLSNESKICYDKVWDDWADDDLNGLTVLGGSISATVTSSIPAEVTKVEAYLFGYDQNGTKTKMTGTATLPAKAKDYDLFFTLSGVEKLTRIYGLELKVRASGAGESLNSGQTVSVKNVKATINGYYDKKF